MTDRFYRDYGRRDFLRLSLASTLGLSFSGFLPRLAAAAGDAVRPRACILLWMSGGPSQMDTFDLKPGHKNGGEFKAIDTAAPGVRISEHLPQLARQFKDVAVIRSMTSSEGDHQRATQLLMTGYRPGGAAVNYPVLGSLLAKELGRVDNDLPNYIALSPFRFGDLGAGFLGPTYAPLSVSGISDDPAARANLTIENLGAPRGLDAADVERRFRLRELVQGEFADKYQGAAIAAHKANYDKAARMVKTQARGAFKLEEENETLREAYGRNRFGQGCLLARRLVERGVPFVEVTLANVPGATGASWDSHTNNFAMVKSMSETLDPAFATLLSDLKQRGLLDSTLVLWMGEFGRTPLINNGGRDHFPAAWSAVLAGAGIRGGQAVGRTNDAGMLIEDRPITVPQLFSTICTSLGIDPGSENISPEGRPIALVDGRADPVDELISPAAKRG